MARWLETFPVPEGRLHQGSTLLDSIEEGYEVFPEAFFEYAPWFTNVEKAILIGREMLGRFGHLRYRTLSPL